MRYQWSPRMLRLLRLCAEKGISQRETSIYLGVSPAAVATRACADGISFHGKAGGPLGNRNACKRRVAG